MKRMFSGFFALVLTAGLLAGCGGGSKGNEDGSGKKDINFIFWDYKKGDYNDAMIRAFEKAHPKYKVKVTTAPNKDYETKLTTMISGGSPVDVFLGKSNTVYPQLVDKKFAADITDKAKALDLSKFGTMLKNQYEIDGKYYGLPYRTNDWVLFYNKKIFDDAKVPYPTNDMTWQQVRELAKKVTSGEGAGKIYGLGFQPKPGFILPMLVGNIPDFSIVKSDLSGLKMPLEFFNALQYEDKTLQEISESKSMSQDQTYFFKGQIAMYYNGSWMAQMLSDQKDMKFKWGIVKGPHWEGREPAVFVTSTPVILSRKAKNPEGGWELLKFFVGEEGAKVLAANKMIPSYQSEDVMKTYKDAVKLDAESYKAITGNKTYDFGPADIKSGDLSKAFNQELDLFLGKNQDAQQTIDGMTSRRQEILARK